MRAVKSIFSAIIVILIQSILLIFTIMIPPGDEYFGIPTTMMQRDEKQLVVIMLCRMLFSI
jgi:hypothetical protein